MKLIQYFLYSSLLYFCSACAYDSHDVGKQVAHANVVEESIVDKSNGNSQRLATSQDVCTPEITREQQMITNAVEIAQQGREIVDHINWQMGQLAQGSQADREKLYTMALDPNEQHQWRAISALSLIRNDQSANILTEIARRDDGVAATMALDVLGGFPSELAIPRMKNLIEDQEISLHTRGVMVAMMGKHCDNLSEEALLELLKDEDIRLPVLTALGEVGSAKSVEVLAVYANQSQNKTAQSIAQASLNKIDRKLKQCGEDNVHEGESTGITGNQGQPESTNESR